MNNLDVSSCLGADQTARGVVVGEVPGGVELRVEHNYLAMTTAHVAQTAGPSSPGRPNLTGQAPLPTTSTVVCDETPEPLLAR
jgi:hypothetical protein